MASICRAGLHWQAPYNLWAILIACTLSLSLQPSTDLELQESAQARTEALMRLNY
jgi:hypothetical protein